MGERVSATGYARLDRWRWGVVGATLDIGRPIAAIAIALAALVAAILLAGPGASLTTVWVQDVVGFAEGAHRLVHGQLPHVDFATPLGVLFYLIPYVGLLLSGEYGAALPVGLAASLLATTPVLIYVLVTRLRPWLALPVGALLILLVASPMLDGDLPSRITLAMWYNRLCWLWLSLLVMLYLPPPAARAGAVGVDGVVAGLLVALMLYTKVTYALCGLAFLVLWFVLAKDRRRSVLVAVGLIAGIAGVVEWGWGLHRAYCEDVLLATRSGPAMIGGPFQLVRTAIKCVEEITVTALALGFAGSVGALRWRDGVFALFLLGISLGIVNQNTGGGSLVPLIVVLAGAVERVARARDWRPGMSVPLPLLACLALLAVFVAETAVYRAAALAWHYKTILTAESRPGVPAALTGFIVSDFKGYRLAPFAGPGLTAVDPAERDWPQAVRLLRGTLPPPDTGLLTGAEYLFTIGKGVEALAGIVYGDKGVFTYDIYNPFPFILGAPPPAGGMGIYHYGRWYSESTVPAAADVLADVAIVLVPKFPLGDDQQRTLWRLHHDFVARHFAVVRETPYWTVWQRRDAARQATTDGAPSAGIF